MTLEEWGISAFTLNETHNAKNAWTKRGSLAGVFKLTCKKKEKKFDANYNLFFYWWSKLCDDRQMMGNTILYIMLI